MNDLAYFLLMLKGSLLSTGGFGNLPLLHAEMTARHWATDHQFAESLVIGQVSPGPNGLWVISLGYLTHGISGSMMALVALVLPPMLILAIEHAYRRVHDHPAMAGFLRGLSLAIGAIFIMVLITLLRSSGISATSVAIVAAASTLAATGRISIPAILALAGLAGVATYGL